MMVPVPHGRACTFGPPHQLSRTARATVVMVRVAPVPTAVLLLLLEMAVCFQRAIAVHSPHSAGGV